MFSETIEIYFYIKRDLIFLHLYKHLLEQFGAVTVLREVRGELFVEPQVQLVGSS